MRRLGVVALIASLAALAVTPVAVAASAVRPQRGDDFGETVAQSGGTALVGAPGFSRKCVGKVFVYARTRTGVRQQTVLTAPSGKPGDCFGDAVAVSSTPAGTYAVVGAPGRGSGAAYIFARTGTTWQLRATIQDPGSGPGDFFGQTAVVSGLYAIIAAPNAGSQESGAVYVYERSGTTWRLRATLRDPRHGLLDEFGTSLALTKTSSGSFLVIGDPGVRNNAGVAYVFRARSPSDWVRQAEIPNPGGLFTFGDVAAISGSTAVIGAYNNAFVYTRVGQSWHKQARLAGTVLHDQFANAVAISGTRIVIGAPDQSNKQCGTAYEFGRRANRWREIERIFNPHCKFGDFFGFAVALSGRIALIGAPNSAHNTGAAYYLTVR